MSEKKKKSTEIKRVKDTDGGDITVGDIAIKKIFVDVKSPYMANLLATMKKYGNPNPESLLPKKIQYDVKFTLDNCFTAFANGIRRVMVGEIKARCLTFSSTSKYQDSKFIITDPFIVEHQLEHCINGVCIYQNDPNLDVDPEKGYIESSVDTDIELYVKNATNKLILLYSGSLKSNDGKFASDVVVEETQVLSTLNVDHMISLPKLYFDYGFGYQNAQKFTVPLNVSYNYERTKVTDSNGKESFLTSTQENPTKFYLGFRVVNITPQKFVERVFNTLIYRLNRCKRLLENAEDDSKRETDIKHEIRNGTLHVYSIANENRTIGRLIAEMCFILDPNCPFITGDSNKMNPDEMIIMINHMERLRLLNDSIDACKKSLASVRDSLIEQINHSM